MMAAVQHSSPTLPHSPVSTAILTTKEVCRSCDESVERMQLVAELLLLRSGAKPIALHPVTRGGNSYSKSRDAIVANTKGLAICIKDLTKNLKDSLMQEFVETVQQIADKVTVLTEAAAHAAYASAVDDPGSEPAQPGVVDQYSFAKAHQMVGLSCGRLDVARGPLTSDQVLALSKTIATNMAVLRTGCVEASQDQRVGEMDGLLFSNCVSSIDSSLNCFVCSLKQFSSSFNTADRKQAYAFSRPLISTVKSIVDFANKPQFAGQPALLTHHGEQAQTAILAAAMAVVSASTQFLHTASSLLELREENKGKQRNTGEVDKQWQRLVSCAKAVAESCKQLASLIKEHTPTSSPQLARVVMSSS